MEVIELKTKVNEAIDNKIASTEDPLLKMRMEVFRFVTNQLADLNDPNIKVMDYITGVMMPAFAACYAYVIKMAMGPDAIKAIPLLVAMHQTQSQLAAEVLLKAPIDHEGSNNPGESPEGKTPQV